jgi:hypothetical protein
MMNAFNNRNEYNIYLLSVETGEKTSGSPKPPLTFFLHMVSFFEITFCSKSQVSLSSIPSTIRISGGNGRENLMKHAFLMRECHALGLRGFGAV